MKEGLIRILIRKETSSKLQVLIKAMKEDINQQIYFVWNDLLTGNRIGVNSVSNSVQMGYKKGVCFYLTNLLSV